MGRAESDKGAAVAAWAAQKIFDDAHKRFTRHNAAMGACALAAECGDLSQVAIDALSAALTSNQVNARDWMRTELRKAGGAGVDKALLAAQFDKLGAAFVGGTVTKIVASAERKATSPRALRLEELGLLTALRAWPCEQITKAAITSRLELSDERALRMLRALAARGFLRRVFVRAGRVGRVHWTVVEDPEWPAWSSLGLGEPPIFGTTTLPKGESHVA